MPPATHQPTSQPAALPRPAKPTYVNLFVEPVYAPDGHLEDEPEDQDNGLEPAHSSL